MNITKIELAKYRDLESLKILYKHGRDLIKSYNSPQWQNNYPSEDLILRDIENKSLYIYRENNIIVACMSVFDYEETYNDIEGKWLSDKPYKAIHRIATHKDYYKKGIASKLISYVFKDLKANSIRIDTHKLNVPMQNMLEKNGFKYCGIIYLNNADDNIRLAYQKNV